MKSYKGTPNAFLLLIILFSISMIILKSKFIVCFFLYNHILNGTMIAKFSRNMNKSFKKPGSQISKAHPTCLPPQTSLARSGSSTGAIRPLETLKNFPKDTQADGWSQRISFQNLNFIYTLSKHDLRTLMWFKGHTRSPFHLCFYFTKIGHPLSMANLTMMQFQG